MKHVLIKVLSLLTIIVAGVASTPSERPSVIITGYVKVKANVVTLNDIAKIHSARKENEEIIKRLREIKIADAPAPKTNITIPGVKILSLIENAGIKREELGYSIPQVVIIEREGRVISKGDVLPVVQETLALDSNFDLQVRKVSWSRAQIIPIGETKFNVQLLGKPSGGSIPLRITAFVDNKPANRFLATAAVDDWRAVPVLNRTLERGMLIDSEDVELVRLNLFKEPNNIAASLDDVIGRRVKNRIKAGTTIKKNLVDIPPDIPKGRKIVLVYQKGTFHATATGVALEDGHVGDVIQVRNSVSRKVLRAEVKSNETVDVTLQ